VKTENCTSLAALPCSKSHVLTYNAPLSVHNYDLHRSTRREKSVAMYDCAAENVVDEQIPVKFGKLIAGLDVMMRVIFVSF